MKELTIDNPKQLKKIMNDKSLSEFKFVPSLKIQGEVNTHIVNPPKITLNELSIKLNDLYNIVVSGFKQVNVRLDNFESRLDIVEQNQQKDHELLMRVIKLNNLKV